MHLRGILYGENQGWKQKKEAIIGLKSSLLLAASTQAFPLALI